MENVDRSSLFANLLRGWAGRDALSLFKGNTSVRHGHTSLISTGHETVRHGTPFSDADKNVPTVLPVEGTLP